MNRIKQLRTSQKLTQVVLSNALGISQSTLSSWESGRYEPDLTSLQKLSEFFGVSVDYLLGRESAQKESPAASNSDEADLDRELINLLCQLDSPQEEQRVKDFVRGLLAAREAPPSPDK